MSFVFVICFYQKKDRLKNRQLDLKNISKEKKINSKLNIFFTKKIETPLKIWYICCFI